VTLPYSVLIPWADRPVLADTLAQNGDYFARHGVETLVVNAGGDVATLDAIIAKAGVPDVRALHVPGTPFNRSLCLNIGAVASRGEYLFTLDADMVLHSDVFADALPHLREEGRFVAVHHVFESNPTRAMPPPSNGGDVGRPDWSFLAEQVQTMELLTTDGRRAVLVRRMAPGKERPTDGLVLLRKADMLRAGGLNSRLVGWGYEDTDFQTRLQFLLGLTRIEAGEVVHLTHSGAGRDPQAWRRNLYASTGNYSRGEYLGSLERDALEWRDRMAAGLSA
jgi:glycosyltransferase involved in cell wall biosynthesis